MGKYKSHHILVNLKQISLIIQIGSDYLDNIWECECSLIVFTNLINMSPFLSDPGLPGVRSIDPNVCLSVSEGPFWNFKLITDVTLTDQATNLIPTDNTNGNPRQCGNVFWLHLVDNFRTNARGVTWWPNLKLMKVVPLGEPIVNWCKWSPLVAKFVPDTSSGIGWPNL